MILSLKRGIYGRGRRKTITEQAKKKIVHKVKPAAAAPRLERVAAYCRVSSGKDAMLHSLSAQVSRYSEFIQRRPGWAYAGVYALVNKIWTE